MLAVKSAVPGIIWPAFPDGRDTWRIFAVQHQLMESQWLDAEALRARQFRQLDRLLGHAYDESPFYRRRLEAAGYRSGRPLTPEIWQGVPILTREDIQRHHESLGAITAPPSHGAAEKAISSGSTGKPIRARITTVARFVSHAFSLRDHLWHGRDPSRKTASIRVADQAPRTAATVPPEEARVDGGLSRPSHNFDIGQPIEKQAEWLGHTNPAYLITHPSNLRALAEFCLDKGMAIPRLRQVMTTTEVLSPETRAACREAWGVEVKDVYSSVEGGIMALQCPDNRHYHVQAEGAFLEVLDGERVCGPGEIGRVVSTRLHNFAMPLIREEIGDYAEVGPPCSCGRGLPVLKRILGRVRNLITLPTGERYWPLVGGWSLSEVVPVKQFQVIQTSLQAVEVRLVVPRALSDEEEEKVKRLVSDRLGYPFTMSLTYHDEIPRGPGGKFEDFRSEVAQ